MRGAPLDSSAQQAAQLWDSTPWQVVAPSLAEMHERVVASLAPRAADSWLDVATGTGAVALLAARAGATVTGVDVSERMLRTARELADAEGLPVAFDVGDAQSLPYEDASFDVVSSCLGVIFAPDADAAAVELARVCRPGGRLGVTAWREGPHSQRFKAVLDRFRPPQPSSPPRWGDEDNVTALLGDLFELDLVPSVWLERGASGEEIWQRVTTGAPMFRRLADSLPPEGREELHREFVAYHEQHRTERGIETPAEYLLVLGRRRV